MPLMEQMKRSLEIAEAYHQFRKSSPKKQSLGSICIIWGYLFGGLGLGFVTDIIQIEVPCVSDMVGAMNATSGNHDVTKNGALEIAEDYNQFPKSGPKKPSLDIDMHYLGLLVRRSGFRLVTDIIQIEVPCVSDMVGGHECH